MTWLIAWLWQGTLVAAGTLALLRLCAAVNAATRHVCLWIALVAVLLLPVAGRLAGGTLPVPLRAVAAAAPDVTAATPPSPAIVAPAPPGWLPFAVLGLWGAVLAFGLLRVAGGLAGLRALKRSAAAAPELERMLPAWRRVCGRGRRIALRVSDRCAGPCAAGLWSPMILLPRSLCARLTPSELDALVVHEHAHLARYDDWSQLVQRLVLAVAGLHPAVRLLSRRIELEREAACDDWVLRRSLPAREYATCLAEVAALVGLNRRRMTATLTASATGSAGSLRRRVDRMLRSDIDHGRRVAPTVLGLGGVAVVCATVVAHATTPAVVFETAADEMPAVAPVERTGPAGPAGTAGTAELKFGPTKAANTANTAELKFGPTNRATAGAATGAVPHAGPNVSAAGPALPDVAAAPRPVMGSTLARTTLDSPMLQTVALAPGARGQAPSGWGRLAAAGSGIGTQAGRSGAALGKGAQHAGQSIGAMFGRAARSIGNSF